MSLALVLLLQAGAPTLPAAGAKDPEAGLIPLDFDLKTLRRSDACGDGGPSEIVVCGRRQLNRYFPSSGGFETEPFAARIGLFGNVTAGMHLETVQFPQGVKSNRVMVTFKLPF